MRDDLVATGLDQQRYLKATKLKMQFEIEIEEKLKNWLSLFVPENKESGYEYASKTESPSSTSGYNELLYHRIKCDLNRVNDKDDTLSLNLRVVWKDADWLDSETADECIVTYLGYKITNTKGGPAREIFADTTNHSQFETLRFDGQAKNADGVFYYPISEEGHTIKEGLDVLQSHFNTYIDRFGHEPE